MANLSELIRSCENINAAITNALEVEVAEAAKKAISESAIENVYKSYSPKFLSRRDPQYGGGHSSVARAGGGVTDIQNMTVTVSGDTLTVSDDAPWQHLWGGSYPNVRLAEAIASGSGRFNMQKAGPRPFHELAKEKLISTGEAERALRAGLARQGIDTSGMKFDFV